MAAKSRVLAFLAPFVVAWPDTAVEDHYVAIRSHLEALGTPISEADLWIAATARAAAATLVTNNTREFSRVPGSLARGLDYPLAEELWLFVCW